MNVHFNSMFTLSVISIVLNRKIQANEAKRRKFRFLEQSPSEEQEKNHFLSTYTFQKCNNRINFKHFRSDDKTKETRRTKKSKKKNYLHSYGVITIETIRFQKRENDCGNLLNKTKTNQSISNNNIQPLIEDMATYRKICVRTDSFLLFCLMIFFVSFVDGCCCCFCNIYSLLHALIGDR